MTSRLQNRIVEDLRQNKISQLIQKEQNLLGCILIDPEKLDDVHSTLTPADFYSEKHNLILAAMLKTKMKGIPLDILTLRNILEDEQNLEAAGESTYLTYLTEIALPDSEINYYINEIKRAGNNRKILEVSHSLIRAIELGEDQTSIREKIQQLVDIPSRAYNSQPLNPISAKDLNTVSGPECIWENVLYKSGITLINSPPGIGKTTLAYNIAVHGATGQTFLGKNVAARKVLLIDAETPYLLRKVKIERISEEVPENIYFLDAVDFRREYDHLLNLCLEEEYDLIFFDTMSRILGMEKENDNSEANYCMGLLRRLAHKTGAAIVLIHHTTKGDNRTEVYRGRGASAIAAAVDVVLNIDSLSSDTLKMYVAKNRIGGPSPALVIRKAGEDKFELIEQSQNGDLTTTQEIHQIQRLIIELMTNEPKPLRTADILEEAEREGYKTRTIEDALSRLWHAGKIEKPRQGLYALRKDKISANPASPMARGTAEPAESSKFDGSGGLK